MARTKLAKVTVPGGYAHAGAAVAFAAGDATFGNSFEATGQEFVLVRNVNASSPPLSRTVTFVSANDLYGRTKDFTETLAAGAVKVYGPFPLIGWRQGDGLAYIDVSHADIELAVVELLR